MQIELRRRGVMRRYMRQPPPRIKRLAPAGGFGVSCAWQREVGMGDVATGLGYLLLGGVFVWGGFDHFLRFGIVSAMLAGRKWPAPGPLLAIASAFEITAGLGLALGILRPLAALGLAAFTLVATLLLLDFWRFEGPEREGMRSGLTINVAVLGGLLLAFGQSV